MNTGSVDIAVIGGGISGLYTAWRLSSGPDPPRVAVFESSPRLGGRIDTVPLPVPSPGASAELGAMRFFPFMAMVKNLLEYLGIQTEVFPGNTPRQMFLRNVQLNPDGSGTNLPYQLATGEPTSPFGLIERILDGSVPNAVGLSARQWRDVTRNGRFKGHELWRWGVRNIAEELISNEAYEFVYDGAGLDSMFLKTNAAIGMRCIATPLPDYIAGRVYRPVRGFGSLVAELENRLEAYPSCHIFRQHRLMSVGRAADGIELNFAPGAHAEIACEQTIASKVVLALPRRAVELIDFDEFFPAKQRDAQRRQFQGKLADVEGIPAFKLCVVYEKAWWQGFTDNAGVARGWKDGYSVTDLPIRQVFFGMGQGPDPAANERVLLASYTDTEAARYWEGLVNVSPSKLRLGSTFQFHEVGAGSFLLDAIERQLRALLQTRDPLPKALGVAFMNWDVDPYGGGWHEWNPGVDVTEAIPDMRRPVPGAPIYLCGEAYSWFQAWIEGALMSAERMLQDHFQLSWPTEWLPGDYDLGP